MYICVYHEVPKDHMGRVQDQGWHLDGKVEDLPFFEGNGRQALHLWDKSESQVGGWHCYLPCFLEQGREVEWKSNNGKWRWWVTR